MKKGCKLLLVIALIFYSVMASFPAEWLWMNPGRVEFSSVRVGETPRLIFSRDYKRRVIASYSTVTRDAITGDAVCDGKVGPFEYRQVSGPVVGKDLEWWSAGNDNCASLPVGTYVNHTVWTIPAPMRSLLPKWARGTILDRALPPKTVERESAAFQVFEALPI